MPKKKSSSSRPTTPSTKSRTGVAYRLRRSNVHGSGLFATRTIAKGEHIIEYVGEHISHAEADRRHEHKAADDNHTFFFTIDAKTVIDAGVGGNVARFINHSCDPNCEVVMVDGRPFVEALRSITHGEELAYDYNLTREPSDGPEVEKIFGCRCATARCRGTMLALPRKPKPKVKAARKPKPKAKPRARPKRAHA